MNDSLRMRKHISRPWIGFTRSPSCFLYIFYANRRWCKYWNLQYLCIIFLTDLNGFPLFYFHCFTVLIYVRNNALFSLLKALSRPAIFAELVRNRCNQILTLLLFIECQIRYNQGRINTFQRSLENNFVISIMMILSNWRRQKQKNIDADIRKGK